MFSERGELRKQLIYVQLSFALLILIFWGVLGVDWRYVAAVAIMGWGFGDAAAALIGKAFGRRRVFHYLVDLGKTYEGTAAVIAFALPGQGFCRFMRDYSLSCSSVYAKLCSDPLS